MRQEVIYIVQDDGPVGLDRQLDRLLAEALRRAWRAGVGSGDRRLVVDVDSFIGEVHGYAKQGAGFGYTRRRAYRPRWPRAPTPARSCTSGSRKGSAGSPRGVLRFADELIARGHARGRDRPEAVAGRFRVLEQEADRAVEKAGWRYSISVRMQYWVPDAIAQLPEAAWQPLDDYPPDGEAQIAETIASGRRLLVRRTRLIGPQAELWPNWRHFPFITHRTEPLELVEAEHRRHAVCELTIRDLKVVMA